jgi:GAF domain-containing protein
MGKLVNQQTVIQMHRGNYPVFHARTEQEVWASVAAALERSPFICLAAITQPNGFKTIAGHDPDSGKNPFGTDRLITVAPAEIASHFSGGPLIVDLAKTEIPQEINQLFTSQDCVRAAFLPSLRDVETVGLFIFGARDDQELNIDILEPYIQLADLMPVALENVRAVRATRQRLKELESISTISETISSASEMSIITNIIHNQIRNTIGDVSTLIALYNAETETIEVPYLYEEGKQHNIDPFPLGEGLTSILIRTRQPLMLVENAEEKARELGAKYAGRPSKSWLGCPLIVAGEPIGAIVIQDLDHENRFTQDDLRYMVSLSAQVAGAIYNIRLLEDADRRALQLQTVAEISREVSGTLLVDDLLRKATTLVRERFNFYHAGVFLIDASGEYALIREATGEAGVQMKRAGHRLEVGSKSVVGRASKSGSAIVVNETAKDPSYYANPLMPDTRAEVALPLKVGERVLGVLDVQSNKAFGFLEETIRILQILADQLAVAVVNSELFAEAQERLSQHRLLHHVTTAAASSTTIEDALNSAVQGLQVTLGGDQIAIMLADKEQKMLEVRSSIGYPNDESARLKIPFGVGITGWAAQHRQSIRITDTAKEPRYIAVNSKVRSELALPLIYRNEVLGVLNVESIRPNAYSESDEELLGTLAGSLAAIIAHSRLLEQFRQQVERERMLYEVTSRIRRSTNTQTILSVAANEINKAMNAKRTSIKIDLTPIDSGKK